MNAQAACVFCDLLQSAPPETWVLESATSVAFLDRSPVFLGHCLLIPREHTATLSELALEVVGPFFADVQLLTRAVEESMGADGTFVAMNNRVSQSVPHLHVHVVPRQRGDGLRGFFWPRRKYESDEQRAAIVESIRASVARLAALR
jgi:histidine triad (HIT) family protein